MPSRLLVIGLDGADPPLLSRYCDEGVTPHIARLMAESQSAALVKTPGLSDDALWSSFATGTSVGEHGRYHGPHQYFSGSYKPRAFRDFPMQQETFWSRLSAQGHNVAVLDVPKCPVAKSLNGFQVNDWLVHGRDYRQPVSCPPHLAGEVVERFGAPPPSPCAEYIVRRGIPYHKGYNDDEARYWLGCLSKSVDQKLSASLHYLGSRTWDLFVTVFKELHCAGHLYWDFVDPAHPDFEPGRDERCGRPLATLYRRVDAAVAEIMRSAGEGCAIVLLSPHGMKLSTSATPMAELLIERINLSLMPAHEAVARRARRLLAKIRGAKTWLMYDFEDCYCFPVHNNEGAAAVRINLKGREPNGKVAAGAAYDQLCELVASAFLDLRDARTGLPVVAEVVPLAKRNPGDGARNLPDLLVVWGAKEQVGEIVSPTYGSFPPPPMRIRPGNHSNRGIYMQSAGLFSDISGKDADEITIQQLSHRIESYVGSTVRRPADALT